MGIKQELAERTRTNRIQFTSEILKELSFHAKVKGSKVILTSQAEYAFTRWRDEANTQKENCDIGDWIIVDGTSVSFKTQAQYDAMALGDMISPDLNSVIIY